MERFQKKQILKDLEKKMVFITGPRQVGKTWLASTSLLVLDELNKMKGWKNYLKGVFDTKPPELKILVTGSARLDAFRQHGDSLAGRFFRHRLLPFSAAELSRIGETVDLDRLITRGGFPEPFLAPDPIDADRWRMQYVDGLIRRSIFSEIFIHHSPSCISPSRYRWSGNGSVSIPWMLPGARLLFKILPLRYLAICFISAGRICPVHLTSIG